ncbi:MAG: hypothetical protein NC915_06220 [Candidatus Omnitrophica bacterium]|nr:hypothetical protein [Candidatus Omnitrophota bacterium]
MERKEIKITEAQKNSISSVLLILNQVVDEIEFLCKTEKSESILYEVINNLSEKEKASVLKTTSEIKEVIKNISTNLNIKKERYKTKLLISSRVSSLWEMICEIESKRLKGYGEISVSLKQFLDPLVNRIIYLLKSIEDFLHK